MFQTVSYIAFNLSKAWDRPGNMGQVFQPECSLRWSQSIQIEKLNWPSILGNGQESRTITERSGARLYFQLRCLSWRVWATQGQGPLTPPVQCWCHGLNGNPTNKDRVQPLVAKENSRSQSGRARAQLTMKTEWNFKDKIQLMRVQKKKNLTSESSLCTSWWCQRPVGGSACGTHSDPYSPRVKHLQLSSPVICFSYGKYSKGQWDVLSMVVWLGYLLPLFPKQPIAIAFLVCEL